MTAIKAERLLATDSALASEPRGRTRLWTLYSDGVALPFKKNAPAVPLALARAERTPALPRAHKQEGAKADGREPAVRAPFNPCFSSNRGEDGLMGSCEGPTCPFIRASLPRKKVRRRMGRNLGSLVPFDPRLTPVKGAKADRRGAGTQVPLPRISPLAPPRPLLCPPPSCGASVETMKGGRTGEAFGGG